MFDFADGSRIDTVHRMKFATDYTVGLTLGKYAPLHKGHQAVIEKAIREMHDVYVMIYDSPQVTDIPLEVRADWIRQLYPSVRVLLAYDGPKEEDYSLETQKKHQDYIGKILKGKKISHFFSNEPYGDHVSKYLKAEDVRYGDKNICATMIRSNPYQYRYFLHPVVYRSFIQKVCFMGAESTGKSTITKALAHRFHTSFVHEYGADFWKLNQTDNRLTPTQLEKIASIHYNMERDYVMSANRFLFVDTTPITTYMFSQFYHKSATASLERMANKSINEYDFVFLCDIDIPYEDTPDRSGAEHRIRFQQQIIEDLNRRGMKYYLLSGDLETRIKTVSEIITSKKKWE